MTVIPQQLITAGTRRDCIRLRGLPYEAQVEHILEFLEDHAKNIVYQGVHMVFNAQVVSAGEREYGQKHNAHIYRDSPVERLSFRWTPRPVPSVRPTTNTTSTWSSGRRSATSKCSSAVART